MARPVVKNGEARGLAGQFHDAVARLGGCLDRPLDEALRGLAGFAGRCLGREDVFATRSLAIAAVVTAILVAARHLDDCRAAVLEAISLGGDTDTVAAIAGAIVGARLGLDAVPRAWQDVVLAREQVLHRADRLLGLPKDPGWIELVACETQWTRLEARHRAALRPSGRDGERP